VGPCGLPNWLPWKELPHHGLDIEHGRQIDCIQLRNIKSRTLDPEYSADSATESVWTVLGTLRKNADRRPTRVVSRMTSTNDDTGWINLMKQEQNFRM